MKSSLGLLVACVLCAQTSPLSPETRRLNLESFEKVWSTVRDKHWEKNPAGLDWQAIHDEFRPRAEAAATMEDARNVMREMLGRLKQTHFGIVPASIYEDVGRQAGDATPGLELRLLDGHAIVTRIDPASSAMQAGVQLGWELVSVDEIGRAHV